LQPRLRTFSLLAGIACSLSAYARAIGAEPIIQVPLLGENHGQPPTASTAADMVTYANVTNG
jgi:hypothetical protein